MPQKIEGDTDDGLESPVKVLDQRKNRRFWIEFPVMYRIGGKRYTGSTINACNEGMMVESSLALKDVNKVFKILIKARHNHVDLEYIYKDKAWRRKAEIKHFHLDFSGTQSYRLTLGFFIPRMGELTHKPRQ